MGLGVGINPAELMKPLDLNRNYRFDLILINKKSNGLKIKPDHIWFDFEFL